MSQSFSGVTDVGSIWPIDDLAHQLGTGELVGVAPHCRHREGQRVVLCTAPIPGIDRREFFSTGASRRR